MTRPVILVIEDNPISRKMFRITLQLEHYNVFEAESGETALKLARENKFDLILQDLVLDDTECTQLTRQLKETTQNADTPIIAISGFLSYAELPSADFTTILLKPIEPNQLINVVKTYLPTTLKAKTTQLSKYILIADDNLAQCKLLKLQLIHAGFEVITAENGKEALKKIKEHTPDAVVSDVLMPLMDGFELCLTIRHDPGLKEVPVILLTSQYLEKKDLELGKKVAATAYLKRTADALELIALLKKCIKTKPKHVKPQSVEIFKEEHTHRLIRQLEHQVDSNLGLAQQCALQTAQLSLLGGVAEALTKSNSIKNTLKNVLATCLDAAGVSKGLLYVFENKKLSLFQVIGYSKKDLENLESHFKKRKLLETICQKKKSLQIKQNAKLLDRELLHNAKVSTALFIPLVSEGICYGVLFFGSNTTNVTGAGPKNFANTLGIQLGQSMALATTFKQLTDSENRYRTLFENASSGIFVCNKSGIIIEINEQGGKIVQANDIDIVGKTFSDFVAPQDKELSLLLYKKLLKEGFLNSREIRLLRNKQIILVEFSAAKIKTQNELLLLGFVTDVTEKNQLRLRAMLQDRLAIAGTLAASVAHEINNPISWILSNLNYLKKKIVTLKNKKGESSFQDLEEIITESVQGAERISDIVRMFKGLGRTSDEENIYIDIHDILESAIRIASLEFKHRATIKRNYKPNLPKIFANSGQLHQVFLNLIINAAQAIPEGDKNKNHISITTTLKDTNLCIDIADTGRGIESDNLQKIFDPFFTTKEEGIGTGLGLAISHEIITKFGGTITVKSSLKKGTMFRVCLPLKDKEASDQ